MIVTTKPANKTVITITIGIITVAPIPLFDETVSDLLGLETTGFSSILIN